MTEILKTTEGPRYRIDAWPFVAAIIGGPLLVTLVSFWVFLIQPREIMRFTLWVTRAMIYDRLRSETSRHPILESLAP